MTKIFTVLSISKFKDKEESNKKFLKELFIILNSHLSKQKSIDIICFPEYMFGRKPLDLNYIKQVIAEWKLPYFPNIILSTTAIPYKQGSINTILLFDTSRNLHLIGKRYPVQPEMERGIIPLPNPAPAGYSTNVVEITLQSGLRLKIGLLICSDMWQAPYIRELVESGAQALIIPSMTVTLPNHRKYARYQWYSLCITRSREFVIPIVLTDNPIKTETYETGYSSLGVNPSLKNPSIQSTEDFLQLPDENGINLVEFDLKEIEEYRKYRNNHGLRILNS